MAKLIDYSNLEGVRIKVENTKHNLLQADLSANQLKDSPFKNCEVIERIYQCGYGVIFRIEEDLTLSAGRLKLEIEKLIERNKKDLEVLNQALNKTLYTYIDGKIEAYETVLEMIETYEVKR